METKNKTGKQHSGKSSSFSPPASALTKQPESEIHSDYQQLLSIFESIDEPIYVADPQTYELLYTNKVIKKIFGDIAGKKCYQALQNLDAPCPFCTNNYIFGPNLGKTYIWEFQNRVDKRWYRCIDKAIHWPDGRMVRYEMAIDLTVRKFAEQALREAEEKYRHIVENSLDAIIMIQDNKITYANKATCNIFGYSFEELVGKSILKHIAPEHKTMIKDKSAKRLKGQLQPSNYEFTGISKNGTRLFMEASSAGPFIYEQKPTTLSIIRDITDRKQSHKQLRILENAVTQATDGIAIIDIKGNLLFVNDSFAQMHGYRATELPGKHLKIFHTPEQITREVNPFLRKVRQHGHHSGEINHLKKDGTIFPSWISINMLVDENNKPFAFACITVDLTSRRQLKKALAEYEAKYKSLFENSIDGIAITGGKKIYFVNRALLDIGGYKNEKEFLKIPLLKHFTPESGKIIEDRIRKRIEGKPLSSHYEAEVVCKNKKIKNVEMATFPLSIEGQIYSQSTIRDITKRKEAEKTLGKLNEELNIKNKKLKQLSLKDPLTGLYNHLYFEEIIEAELERTRRYAHPLSVIMLDIDYFKSINDIYGHHFGDLILKQLAKQLTNIVRRYDILIRYSGEEFVIISPGTNRGNGATLARRILDAVGLYNFGNKKHSVKLKLSGAVTSYPEDKIIKGTDLVDLAGRILDKAKQSGGNRVYLTIDLNHKKHPPSRQKTKQDTVKYLREKMEKLTKQANQSLVESIFALAKTIELKDHYTGEHVERTVQYATEIASTLNTPSEEVERIRQAAILHDLGKIGVSDKILLKKSKLTKKEFEEIKKHPQIAADILRPIHFLHDLIPYIFYHHERWDGKGYPSGLKRDEIPLGARIISLADVYQALISDRPYRKAFSRLEALKLIKKGSGTQFDPKVVNSFLNIIRQEK